MTQEHIKALRAFVIAKAKAYATGAASYDHTCFTTAYAYAFIGADSTLRVHMALQDLEAEGLVEWHRPAAIPGYWRPTAKAAREVLS
mgnify:CR=1 FL=1